MPLPSDARVRWSVVLCTYNGATYLPAQLRSFAEQTRVPDELVVGDDGSTDGTLDVLESFARTAPFPVRVHRGACNVGSTRNFDRAIGQAAGEFIALSDQDDVWLPGKLARLDAALAAADAPLVVFTDAVVVDADLQPLGYTLWESIGFRGPERSAFAARGVAHGALRALLRRNVVTGATMAFRASLRPLVQPIPKEWIHDGWIALLAATIGRVVLLDEPLILYRQHAANQIGGRRRGVVDEIVRPPTFFGSQPADAACQMRQIAERLREDGRATDETVAAIDAKVGHMMRRAELLGSGNRAWGIVRELASGAYHRYSNGFWSAARDLARRSEP